MRFIVLTTATALAYGSAGVPPAGENDACFIGQKRMERVKKIVIETADGIIKAKGQAALDAATLQHRRARMSEVDTEAYLRANCPAP